MVNEWGVYDYEARRLVALVLRVRPFLRTRCEARGNRLDEGIDRGDYGRKSILSVGAPVKNFDYNYYSQTSVCNPTMNSRLIF